MSFELNQIKEIIEKEVSRRVEEQLQNEVTIDEGELFELFKESFESMGTNEQFETLLELIGLSSESLYDSFAEGTHHMSKEKKQWITLHMMLKSFLDKKE